MSTKNVETIRAAHDSWNKRDFAGTVKNTAENVAYTDQPRGMTANGRNEFRTYLEAWAKAFSDGRISNPQYLDAGDVVITQFMATGTNDGPFGKLKPTGRKVSVPFCEVTRFDKEGRITSGASYYDMYSLLLQMGYVQPMSAAA